MTYVRNEFLCNVYGQKISLILNMNIGCRALNFYSPGIIAVPIILLMGIRYYIW